MNANITNLGVTSIDSLKLRIPISQLSSFDSALNAEFETTNITTSEIIKTFKQTSKKYYCEGYSFYASISNVRHRGFEFEDCITVLINSKQLESRYFEGITLDSIELIYDKIIELGIFNCDFDIFLRGVPTDIDFKKDYEMEMDEYKEIINGCSIMSKNSAEVDIGKRLHKGKNNLGISWGKRESTKYISNPFLKIYHKGLEFIADETEKGSKEFKDLYLNHIDTSKIIRIEPTVKNKRHLESLKLGLKYFTLFDLLSMKPKQNDWIITSAVNKHLSNRTKRMIFKDKIELSPKLQFELDALLLCTSELNWSLVRSLDYFTNKVTDKNTKSRLKKRLKGLYNDYINNTNYAPKVDKVNQFYDSIGWF